MVEKLSQVFITNQHVNFHNSNIKIEGYDDELSKALSKPEKTPNTVVHSRYKLGKRHGNTRIIDTSSVRPSSNINSSISISSDNGNIRLNFSENRNPISTADGYIDDASQAKRGDCYFLAELNAIRNTDDGQALLSGNCKSQKDGSYIVTLPGALKIKNKYEKQGLPCEVTGTYKITKDALERARKSDQYAKGDIEVVAYELAMEAYRAEMYLTNKENENTPNALSAEVAVNSGNFGADGDILSSGTTWDAGFILTGEKSEIFLANNKRYNNVTPYKAGKYGYITREEMAQRTNADISMYEKGISTNEVSSYTYNENHINSMLTKYQNKENDYAITFAVRVAENGPDGETKAGGGHALSVLKITNYTVYVSNPWHPDKVEPIPRKDFIKMATKLVVHPVPDSKPDQTNQNINLTNIINAINNHKK